MMMMMMMMMNDNDDDDDSGDGYQYSIRLIQFFLPSLFLSFLYSFVPSSLSTFISVFVTCGCVISLKKTHTHKKKHIILTILASSIFPKDSTKILEKIVMGFPFPKELRKKKHFSLRIFENFLFPIWYQIFSRQSDVT